MLKTYLLPTTCLLALLFDGQIAQDPDAFLTPYPNHYVYKYLELHSIFSVIVLEGFLKLCEA